MHRMDDLISRQAAIDVEGLDEQIRCEMCRNPMHTDRGCDGGCTYDEKLYKRIMQILDERIKPLPSAQPERKYTLEEVAEILASVIGDECACNINGIDEWLPESCKYTEIGEECPNPKEKHGCWMQFLLQGGAQI